MGLGLKILPAYSTSSKFSIDVYSIPRCHRLYELLQNVESTSGRPVLMSGVSTYIGDTPDPQYGKTTQTPYGKSMIGVRVKEVRTALKNYVSSDYKIRTFLCFVEHAPDELELWLYWN